SLLPGVNDTFVGNAPDAGAYEFAFDAPPGVLSSVRLDSNPTGSDTVNFKVTFSEPVTGVDLNVPYDDFRLSNGPGLSGTSIQVVTYVSNSTYIVSVNTGTGNGTLRLDVVDNDSILDLAGNPLGGPGVGNGDFSTGETYTINRSVTTLVTESFRSNGAYDGWVLEAGENTNTGRALDRGATTFNVGDDARDRQYRGFLSFSTNSLPDNAVIVSAQLKVKRQGIVGNDPSGTHGALLFEIRNGSFSNNIALQAGDFSAAASPGSVRGQVVAATSSWYGAQLVDANLPFISRNGTTQFRLFFSRDDNDDRNADYVKFFSGNSTSANVPQLIVTYYVP
ncbi:MAG: DNRLRE domain-containing protein, partial [Bacteroidota bacterium]